jgi:CBS domain-containing protein
MARSSFSAVIPDELKPAIVLAPEHASAIEGADLEPKNDIQAESSESGVWRTGSAKIAHVTAGDDGVEQVEVTVSCPHCSGSVLIDVAHEDAFMTALSLIAGPDATSDDDLDRPTPASVREAVGVTERDVPLSKELHSALRSVPVARAMNASVVWVRADEPVSKLPDVFAQHVNAVVIVTDEDHRPIGDVTADDLLRAAGRQPTIVGERVQQVMMQDIFRLRMDAPLARALELFTSEGALRIAVIGDNGKLAGVLAPADLLRFAASAA